MKVDPPERRAEGRPPHPQQRIVITRRSTAARRSLEETPRSCRFRKRSSLARIAASSSPTASQTSSGMRNGALPTTPSAASPVGKSAASSRVPRPPATPGVRRRRPRRRPHGRVVRDAVGSFRPVSPSDGPSSTRPPAPDVAGKRRCRSSPSRAVRSTVGIVSRSPRGSTAQVLRDRDRRTTSSVRASCDGEDGCGHPLWGAMLA